MSVKRFVKSGKALSCFCLVLTLCAGCFPYHYSNRPGVQGTAVDRQTGSPLANATVSLAFIRGEGNPTNNVCIWHTNTIVVTNGNESGHFEIPPIRHWGIYIIPMDIFPGKFEVAVECANFDSAKTNFLHSPMATGKGATRDLGNIPLDPKK